VSAKQAVPFLFGCGGEAFPTKVPNVVKL